MIRLKTFSLFAASLSTVFLFLFFSSYINAQSSSSLYNIYSPQSDYSNINVPQADYSNIYTPQMDYSNIYTPESDQSNIYLLNKDLIDLHQTSLYESIHSSENSSGSLLIVKDDEGNVISIINLHNGAENRQNNFKTNRINLNYSKNI